MDLPEDLVVLALVQLPLLLPGLVLPGFDCSLPLVVVMHLLALGWQVELLVNLPCELPCLEVLMHLAEHLVALALVQLPLPLAGLVLPGFDCSLPLVVVMHLQLALELPRWQVHLLVNLPWELPCLELLMDLSRDLVVLALVQLPLPLAGLVLACSWLQVGLL